MPLNQGTDLNDCGCCDGITAVTPETISNRPGLTAIAYRVGNHPQFKETMLDRLSGSKLPALEKLTTRDDDDFSIALLDAWATVADVLTFYQERIANESYLRTATERRSVLELARLIGYELRPGVAAGTFLAFTLDDSPGALGQAFSLGTTAQASKELLPPITIGVGTKIQSVPGPGETAVTFETVEQIEARVDWNAIKPLLVQPQTVTQDSKMVILRPAATDQIPNLNLNAGDMFLLQTTAVKQAVKVAVDNDAKTTTVYFVESPVAPQRFKLDADLPLGSINSNLPKKDLDQTAVDGIIAESWESEDLSALVAIQGWSGNQLVSNIQKRTYPRTPDSGNAVMVFRQRAAIFGYNAPDYDLLRASFSLNQRSRSPAFPPPPSWEHHTIEEDNSPGHVHKKQRYIFLDTTYPGIVRGSWIALIDPALPHALVLQVTDNQTVGHINFTISGKVSRLTVMLPEGQTNLSAFKMRTTSVLAVSEPLMLADLPIDDPVPSQDPVTNDDTIVLDGVYLGLKKGRNIILTGQRADLAGVSASEVRSLKDVRVIAGFTVISLDQPLAHSYIRKTVVINANIAASTHGESVQETLGAGDASQQWQRFTLRQPPLTYVSAPTPSGGQTTLEVRVDDVLWHEAPNFYGHDSDERVYVTRMDDTGNTTVIFGGGTRLPTGQENIKAKYRKGIGLSGLVRANQLTQLMSRPLGLKGVTNPLAPSGAADPEKLQDARRNAPLTVLTLDRVVSLQDYEDFARAFSGIDKALATQLQLDGKTGVYLTVAGSNGAPVDESGKLYSNLVNAISAAGDSSVPFRVKSYNLRLFTLSAAVKLDPDLLQDDVLGAIRAQLRDSFSFEARSFGQPVHLSEVTQVIQSVPGVIGAEVRTLYLSDQPSILNTDLTARVPKPGADIKPAELLALDPRPVVLEVIQ